MAARHTQLIVFAVVAALLALVPLLGNDYHLTVMTFAGIFALAAVGLNLLTGFAGQVSFGHSAFFGIGAYGSAILTASYGWHSLLALLVTMLVGATVALLVGFPTLRLRGHYLAMGTAALGLIAYVCFAETESLTNGFMGIPGVPPLGLAGLAVESGIAFYALTWLCVLLAVAGTVRLTRSHVGRVLQAIRGNETATRTLGVNTLHYKLAVFVVSACLATLAGSLFAHKMTFVSPESFSISLAIQLIVIVFIGGIGTIWGPVAGAVVIAVLPEALRQYQDYSHLLYGLLLIVVLVFAPRGIVGEAAARWRRFRPTVPAPAVGTPGAAAPAGDAGRGASLEVRGLTKRFAGIVAVDDVDFAVDAGQIVGLIGPNGAGKTTALNLISGLLSRDAGEISVDGRPVHAMAPYRIAAAGIGRTFQKVKLFPGMSVLEHVLVGCHPWNGGFGQDSRVVEEAWRSLALVGLGRLAHEQAVNLPFGSQRLVEIARAVAGRPRLLLLDEPAAGLNSAETAALAALIRRLRDQGVTIVVIEHDMELVMSTCDRLVVLDFGRKIAEGTPEQVRAEASVRQAYLGVESVEA